jgi:hypothetical protein
MELPFENGFGGLIQRPVWEVEGSLNFTLTCPLSIVGAGKDGCELGFQKFNFSQKGRS